MSDSTYLLDNFVQTKPGSAYRLFPFGTLVKNGKRREITPEYAANFHLPHFLPPIKLGSHDDPTPAGGHIVSLEVRADANCRDCASGKCSIHGLFAVPEWNEKGEQANKDGAYRYQSPEVLWEDGALENPETGDAINGPLILGCALLHTPHLGQRAALYAVETYKENAKMENVTVPASLWEKFNAFIDSRLTPPTPEKVEVIPDDYAAAKQERDELKAKIETQEKDAARKALVEKFNAELKETKADPALAELLAGVPAETAEAIMRQFKALSEQVKEGELTGEKGQEGEPASRDPKAEFNAAVLAMTTEKGINYNAAFAQVKADKPDLFAEAFKK